MSDTAPKHVLKLGLYFIVVGIAIALLPLLLGHWNFNKYIVVTGVIAFLLGLNFCLQGALDRWKSRR